MAQSVWWLASVIGLQKGLFSHIDNLRERSDIALRKAIPQAKNTINQIDTSQNRKEVSPTPRDIQEYSRTHNESGYIHPDRIPRVHNTIHDISDLQLSSSSPD